ASSAQASSERLQRRIGPIVRQAALLDQPINAGRHVAFGFRLSAFGFRLAGTRGESPRRAALRRGRPPLPAAPPEQKQGFLRRGSRPAACTRSADPPLACAALCPGLPRASSPDEHRRPPEKSMRPQLLALLDRKSTR